MAHFGGVVQGKCATHWQHEWSRWVGWCRVFPVQSAAPVFAPFTFCVTLREGAGAKVNRIHAEPLSGSLRHAVRYQEHDGSGCRWCRVIREGVSRRPHSHCRTLGARPVLRGNCPFTCPVTCSRSAAGKRPNAAPNMIILADIP